MDKFIYKYLEEATELLADLEDSLLVLENNSSDKDSISQVFRIMHTLKGNSAMFGFQVINDFTHHLENIYDLVRQGKLLLTKEIFDVTLASVDHLRNLLKDSKLENKTLRERNEELTKKIISINTNSPEKVEVKVEHSTKKNSENDLISSYYIYFNPVEDILKNGTNPFFLIEDLCSLGKCFSSPKHIIPDIHDIKTDKCYTNWHIILETEKTFDDIKDVFIFVEDECDLRIEKISEHSIIEDKTFIEKFESISSHTSTAVELSEIQLLFANKKSSNKKVAKIQDEEKSVEATITKAKDVTISSIRVPSEKIDEMMNLVSELITIQARLSLYSENNPSTDLINIAENIQKLSRQLRDNAFSISLIPIQSVITRFQRLVRDLSVELGKDVEFITEGAETELDKNIIEKLSDPLMHIIRNSLDHGIEDKATRLKLGKPATAKLLLKAFYSGINVFIQVIDDGAGIDVHKIRQKAISMGVIQEDTVLTERETLDLIFHAGLSTATKITDVSGRGVGMDVVKRKISETRGEVLIDSEKGKGTTITIKLPLTLSIIDGLLVLIEKEYFIIPLSGIFKCYAVKKTELDESFNSIVILDGEQVPTVNLRSEFNLQNNMPDVMQVVVVMYNEQKVGIAIDTIVGEYQAVLKPLGKIYKNQEFISGATILGDGTIALVLDPFKIITEFDSKSKTI